MTEQRFDIVVTDKVARTIKTELAGIGAGARSAYSDLKMLNGELGARSAAAASQAQGAAVRTATATARLNAEQAKLATQTARVAAEQAKASTAYLREETALNRAVAAEQRAIASKERAAQASARSVAAVDKEAAALGRLAATARQEVNQRRASAFLAPSGGGKSARDSAGVFEQAGLFAGMGGAAAARGVANVKAIGAESKLSAQYAAQLGFQLNDVFVSLASGQKPLTVFIQQGAQIAQIPAQAGMSWKAFGSAVLNTLGIVKTTGDAALFSAAQQALAGAAAVASVDAQALANVAAARTEIALATAQQQAAITATEAAVASGRLTAANQALAVANAEAAITSRALATAQGQAAEASSAASATQVRSLTAFGRGGLIGIAVGAAFVVTLGSLNHQANEGATGLKRYSKEMGYTAKEVEKLNAVSVGWGDTAKAVFQVGMRNIAAAFGISTEDIANAWGSAMNFLASVTRNTVAGLYAMLTGLGYAAVNVFKAIKSGNPGDIVKGVFGAPGQAYGDAQSFMDDVIKQSQTNARNRQDKLAEGMFNAPASKKGAKGGKGWDRAKELRDANQELDAQINLLGKYGSELERAQQIEQIGQQFREHGKPLTVAEIALLDAKIKKLQEGQRVQEAMTAAEEAANGPQRKYNDTISALNNLLDSGAISLAQYNAQMNLATRAFEDATNPLAALNRELQRNGDLMGLYGRDKDVAQYIQQLQQAAEAQGKSIFKPTDQTLSENGDITVSGDRKPKLTDEAQSMVDEFRKQQQQEKYTQTFEAIDPRQREDPTSNSYILDHHKELYAEIDRLRQADVISEEEAANRKQNVDRSYLDARLEATSSILGQLSTLQNSKNKEVAALGKAAAIAQATIDGYRAVQAALAGPPGPPWSFAIAGVTAAVTAANVARIAGVGFQGGGFTGSGSNTSVAGPVHRNEFVMDAAATSRIGVPALEAMRNGSTLSQPGMRASGGPRVSVYPQPGVYMEEVSTSDDHIEMIARRITRAEAPQVVAADVRSGSNSPMGRAMRGSFGLQRADR